MIIFIHRIAFSALTLLVGRQKGSRPVKNGEWWRWALVSPDGVAPSWKVSVSASVNLPLHHKVQKFYSGTGSPGWSRKKGRKTIVCMCVLFTILVDTDTKSRLKQAILLQYIKTGANNTIVQSSTR